MDHSDCFTYVDVEIWLVRRCCKGFHKIYLRLDAVAYYVTFISYLLLYLLYVSMLY